MRRLVFACCMLVATLIAPVSALGQDDASGDPLDARIGGTRASFEAVYGEPTNDPNALVLEYAVRPFGRIEVTYDGDQVFTVSAYADRLAHEPLTDPDDKDFNSARGSQIAQKFLPSDVEIHELRQRRSNGDTLVRCHSESLAAAFPVETYREFGFQGQPGDCQFRLHADDAKKFYRVELTLGDGLPQAAPQEQEEEEQSQEEESSSSSNTSGGLTAEEEEYLSTVRAEILLIAVSLERIGDLFINAEEDDLFDEDWLSEVALVLAIWRVTYEANLALDPPARYVDLHSRYVSGLALLDSATYDIANAFDTFNFDLLEPAGSKIEQAGTILLEVATEVVTDLEGA